MTPISDKLLLQEVKRYPICYTGRDQSVAEHSFNVAMIALYLIEDSERYKEAQLDILMYALHHDMEEIKTGDIPSCFKRKLRADCPSVIKLLDGEYFVPHEIKGIVKMADCLEAIYYLRHFGGSRYAMEIIKDIEANFQNIANSSGVDDQVRLRAIEMEKTL